MSINLFYPASYLPHKNHNFLKSEKIYKFLELNDIKINLTIENKNIDIISKNINMIGRLNHERCLFMMKQSSALLFLSSFESLGLPILEAEIFNKSIILPKLPYSVELIGNTGYFLEYPLSENNFFKVLKKFKYDFINNYNYPAKLALNPISSKEIIKLFLNKLKIKL